MKLTKEQVELIDLLSYENADLCYYTNKGNEDEHEGLRTQKQIEQCQETITTLKEALTETGEFQIEKCDKCMQITNHIDGVCQKCKLTETDKNKCCNKCEQQSGLKESGKPHYVCLDTNCACHTEQM